MIDRLPPDIENTPQGELCILARKTVEAVHARINGPRTAHIVDFPNWPSAGDFLEFMGLHITRALLAARKNETELALEKEAQQEGRRLYLLNRALELQRQIDKVNIEIRARHLPA
jgi:hypothetical protein